MIREFRVDSVVDVLREPKDPLDYQLVVGTPLCADRLDPGQNPSDVWRRISESRNGPTLYLAGKSAIGQPIRVDERILDRATRPRIVSPTERLNQLIALQLEHGSILSFCKRHGLQEANPTAFQANDSSLLLGVRLYTWLSTIAKLRAIYSILLPADKRKRVPRQELTRIDEVTAQAFASLSAQVQMSPASEINRSSIGTRLGQLATYFVPMLAEREVLLDEGDLVYDADVFEDQEGICSNTLQLIGEEELETELRRRAALTVFRRKGMPNLAIQFRDGFGAAFGAILLEYLGRDDETRRCAYCRRSIEDKRGNAKFCSDQHRDAFHSKQRVRRERRLRKQKQAPQS